MNYQQACAACVDLGGAGIRRASTGEQIMRSTSKEQIDRHPWAGSVSPEGARGDDWAAVDKNGKPLAIKAPEKAKPDIVAVPEDNPPPPNPTRGR